MGIPGGANLLLAAGGVSTYEIDQSLRFDGSSYLSWTPSSNGNFQTWTVSTWIKNATTVDTATRGIFGVYTHSFLQLYFSTQQIQVWDGATSRGITSARFRDPSAWYHILYKCTSNSLRLYVNNQLVFGPVATSNSGFNRNLQHVIGRGYNTSGFIGYIAEHHQIDGTALDPTDFGEYDDNGVWRPIEVSGLTYGTNGFYLKFDPSATNGIGHDHSGNGNNFSASGFDTSGSTGSGSSDVVTDSPTNNFAVLNPLMKRHDRDLEDCVKEAGLRFKKGDGNNQYIASSIACPGSGKWYFEFTVNVHQLYVGVAERGTWVDVAGIASKSVLLQMDSSSNYYIRDYYTSSTQNLSGESSTGQVYSMRYDADNGTVAFYNASGTQFGSTVTGLTTGVERFFFISGQSGAESYCNFGQQDWAHTLPSGYQALCTANLPAPDIADGSQYFDIATWSGNSASSRDIPLSNSSIVPDLVWVKPRGPNNANHVLFDAVRGFGSGKGLSSDTTGAEGGSSDATYGYVSGTAAGEFTVNYATSGNLVNLSGQTYVGWAWDAGGSGSSNTSGSITSTVSANPSAGFSIVSYTGNGTSGSTVGHGLGVAPSMIITKIRSATGSWPVYHSTQGAGKYTYLDTTGAFASSTGFYGGVEPTSTVYTIGNNARVNSNGNTFIAYCFAEVEGYSKFGSYTGNGSSNGPFVYCGFRPALVVTRNVSSGSNWQIMDSVRSPDNPTYETIYWNKNNAESTQQGGTRDMDFLSNGFKLNTNGYDNNSNGYNYVFMAFAENPFGGDGVSPATAR